MIMKVGVAGYSGPIALPPVSEIADECVELGRRLAEKGHLIVNGGRDGVMELVSRGAKEVGGKVVGVLPFVREGANEYLDFALFTGLDFQMRSFVMLKNMDVMVAVGGEVGTAIEILGAYANAIPVILFRGTGGWADRFANVLIEGRYLDTRKTVEVYQAWSVSEILDIIETLAH